MKKLILISILIGLLAAPALAGSSLGTWNEGDPGTTHQYWDFSSGYVRPSGAAYVALPEDADNPYPNSLAATIIGGTYDSTNDRFTSGSDIRVSLEIGNYENLNNYKEIWVDVGSNTAPTVTGVTAHDGGAISFTWTELPGQGDADFGIRIVPNPWIEEIFFTIPVDAATGTAVLDYIHVDTICTACSLDVTKEACVIVPGGDDCQGKVIRMELEYTGDGCSASRHTQDSKKVKCSGDVDGAALVHIVVPGKAAKAKKGQPAPAPIYWNVPSNLLKGESVFVDAAYGGKTIIDNDTLVIITDPDTGNVEEVKFHTSCSQPLSVGDQFGSMKVISMTTTEGGQSGSGPGTCITEIPATGADVEYTYTITNTGAVEIKDVNVFDDGVEVPGSPIDSILPGNSVVLKLTEFLSVETTNTVVVTAAEGCRAEDTATITQAPPKCTTKVKAMLLEYIGLNVPGPVTVTIKAEKFKKANIDPVIYDIPGGLLNGYLLFIDASAYGLSELGNKTEISINGSKEKIHTSCSTPFIAGEPAPLDKPKGDPSPNWLVVDFKQK